jgi:hypothetical protein
MIGSVGIVINTSMILAARCPRLGHLLANDGGYKTPIMTAARKANEAQAKMAVMVSLICISTPQSIHYLYYRLNGE